MGMLGNRTEPGKSEEKIHYVEEVDQNPFPRKLAGKNITESWLARVKNDFLLGRVGKDEHEA